MSNAEFSGVAARYFALPSSARTSLVWQRIGQRRAILYIHGSRCTAASLPGDGFHMQHDTIKWCIEEDMREMGLRCKAEVYGLVAAVLPQQAQTEVGQWTKQK